MVTKPYDWVGGAKLDDHSLRKLKILREYFLNYLEVRCQHPQQTRFRLAVIDGFAGGGRYTCGTGGSPVVFLEGLRDAIEAINLKRHASGLDAVEIECLLLLNDHDKSVAEILKENVAPLCGAIKETVPRLHTHIEFLNQDFEDAYPNIKRILTERRYGNVLFNLDQSGHSQVHPETLFDIMHTYRSAEVFFTFAIEALIAFLQKDNPEAVRVQLGRFGISDGALKDLDGIANKRTWLGAAECLVFEALGTYAPYVSPFSINNPDGWRYWLVHFANVFRARQVYNNVLHDNSSTQAHFGRSGLRMLHFDPEHEEGDLYLFNGSGREAAKGQLPEDIPRLISDSGDAMEMVDFYRSIYNETPAHTEDIHAAIIENPDIEIITPGGGVRRKANTITVNDVLKLKDQLSFPRSFWRKPEDS